VELYLVRHGIAVDRDNEIEDDERALTAQGRQKTQKVAKRLEQIGLRFDLILTSPLVRSRQTAEILQNSGLSPQIEASASLAPDGNIETWLSWLEQWRQVDSGTVVLALVGHQPNLGQWAEILVWGEVRDGIALKKAGIVGLTLPETASPVGLCQLFLLTQPKFLL